MGVNTYGDNPFQPGQVSDTYVPDQDAHDFFTR